MTIQRLSIIPHRILTFSLTVILLALMGQAQAGALKDFTSDGCSLFPDGTLGDRAKWCACCLQHDIAYWRGGTEDERKLADAALRDCVWKSTSDRTLADTMYLGVRAGGHPVFPSWYRWGYGWRFGRGYRSLDEKELQQVNERLELYMRNHPAGYCSEKHGTAIKEPRDPAESSR